jgi:hypothetical protein
MVKETQMDDLKFLPFATQGNQPVDFGADCGRDAPHFRTLDLRISDIPSWKKICKIYLALVNHVSKIGCGTIVERFVWCQEKQKIRIEFKPFKRILELDYLDDWNEANEGLKLLKKMHKAGIWCRDPSLIEHKGGERRIHIERMVSMWPVVLHESDKAMPIQCILYDIAVFLYGVKQEWFSPVFDYMRDLTEEYKMPLEEIRKTIVQHFVKLECVHQDPNKSEILSDRIVKDFRQEMFELELEVLRATPPMVVKHLGVDYFGALSHWDGFVDGDRDVVKTILNEKLAEQG